MLDSVRRSRLRLGASLGFLALLSTCARALAQDASHPTGSEALTKVDNDLLDDIARRSFRYFSENTNPQTGLALDRARTNGEPDDKRISSGAASIAATGFGLTSFCIAASHRWISHETARQRVLTALNFFANEAPHEHGWFYHFMDASTGERLWNSEVSSIDTALLLAGVLTARQFFQDDPQVTALANLIYQRVDFPWMMDGSSTYFSHGWKPESGFLRYRWDTYSELMILYVLGIGSPTHSISSASWNAWKLPLVDQGGYSFIGGGPLFIHQYSQAWIDLRDRGRSQRAEGSEWRGVDYFANSVAATRAQREVCSKRLSREFPGYSSNVWGVTASDSANGYTAWGDLAKDSRIDGTVVPSAAAGSLMFAPDICVPAMRAMLVRYGKKIYGRYGFADAFNPNTGWVSQYVIGIDAGIALLSAENLRNGRIWQWFMSNAEPARALDLAGLGKVPGASPIGGVAKVAR